jgi:hydrogenase maturation protease
VKQKIRSILENKEKRILFTGVGNLFRNDDGVGVYIASAIKERDNISTLLAEVSIENYISKINSISPDILVITDCLDFNREPGYVDIIPVSETKEFTVSSHNISLKRISLYLKMKVYVLGVQPADLRVGEHLSEPVKESADKIIGIINNL